MPGGLFGDGGEIVESFYSDPNQDAGVVLLDEKQVDVNYDSTVNVISAMTVERDTRNPIVYVHSAVGADNYLLYKKVWMLDQPAYGELEVCRNAVEELSKRMFKPILKAKWKVAWTETPVQPLEFVKLDGQKFRVMSIKRSFDANTNDMTTNFEGEWLGG